MNAMYIEQNQIIDRYLLGKLSEQQADELEMLCLHDQKVLAQLELSEKMLAGFRYADAQNMLEDNHAAPAAEITAQLRPHRNIGSAAAVRQLPVWHYATAASFIISICLVSALAVFSQRDLPASAYAPQINTPIFELTQTRSAATEPDYIIRISAQPEWMVLSMDLAQTNHAHYRATLLDQTSTVVWQSDGLEPNYQGSLTLSLNSAQLVEGNYIVKIEGLGGAERAFRVGEYAFAVKPRD